MHTTYHFKSASEITIDILNAIKTTFKEKSVIITVEEDEEIIVPLDQIQFVRNSIEKYSLNPEELLNEQEAWKMINSEK